MSKMKRKPVAEVVKTEDAEDLNKLMEADVNTFDDPSAFEQPQKRPKWDITKLLGPRIVPELPKIKNPNWPWRELPVQLQAALQEANFSEPTAVQREMLNLMRKSLPFELVGSAPTGSGKTLAFSLPILRHLSHSREGDNELAALVIVPTRELALQTAQHMEAAGKFLPLFRCVTIVGGLSDEKQQRLLTYRPSVIVATPGRLAELAEYDVALQASLSSVPFLVIDEADRMVMDGKGRFPDLESVFRFLALDEAKKRHVFLFSATLTDNKVKEAMKVLRRRLMMSKPMEVHVDTMVESRVKEYKACVLGNDEKDRWMFRLLQSKNHRKMIFFVNSIDAVKRLHRIMILLCPPGIVLCQLHSKMQQRQRLKYLDRFKAAEQGVLICTDVAARGIDIPTVDAVIQFEIPKNSDTYQHRRGRTGRAGREGISVLLVNPKDAVMLKSDEDLFKAFQRMLEYPTRFELHSLTTAFSIANEIEHLVYEQDKARRDTKLSRRIEEMESFDNELVNELLIDPGRNKKYRQLKGQLSQELKFIK